MAAARSEPLARGRAIFNPFIADYTPEYFPQHFIDMAYTLFNLISSKHFKDNRGKPTEISDYPDREEFPVGARIIINSMSKDKTRVNVTITQLFFLRPDLAKFGTGWKLVQLVLLDDPDHTIDFEVMPKTMPSVYELAKDGIQYDENRTDAQKEDRKNSINAYIRYMKTLVAPFISEYVNREEQRRAAKEARVAQRRQQDAPIEDGKWVSYIKGRWKINPNKIKFIGEWGVTGLSWTDYSSYNDFGNRFRNPTILKICVQWERLRLYNLVGVCIRTNEGMRYLKVKPIVIKWVETPTELEERLNREAADEQAIYVDSDGDKPMGDAAGRNNVTLRL